MEGSLGDVGLSGQFTLRQDEEQIEKMNLILELLISAGYYRAKIEGLSVFDKIVGGMVYCIQLCAEAVDVDLLYSENSSIGQKIALTENIVKVLPKFKCPHSIEPHQIQGLDCIHIYPWLVKEAIEAKEKYGDEILRYSAYQFEKCGWRVVGEQPVQVGESSEVVKPKPVRKLVRDQNRGDMTLEEDVRCTLLEYGLDVADVVKKETTFDEEMGREKRKEIEADFLKDLQVTERLRTEMTELSETDRKRVSAKQVSAMIDSSDLERVARASAGLRNALEDQGSTSNAILELEQALAQLEVEETEWKEELQRLESELQSTEQAIRDYDDIVASTDPERVEQAKRVLEEVQKVRTAESDYKRECRQQMADLEKQIAQLETADARTPDSLTQLEQDNQRLQREVVDLNRQIFYVTRKVDQVPSQIELNQYQRRFVELYNLVTAKHLEARRMYMYHNSLVDECKFIRREIDLLNNVDEQRELALKDEYKVSFVDNLRKIVAGIDESLDKIMEKRRNAQKQLETTAERLHQLREQDRLYIKTVADFQSACQKCEQMRKELEKQGKL